MTNMKPADELLTIRNRIKELQAREAEIKTGMQDGELSLAGDFAVARLVQRNTSRFDRKAAEAELGSLERFVKKGKANALLLDELVQEAAE